MSSKRKARRSSTNWEEGFHRRVRRARRPGGPMIVKWFRARIDELRFEHQERAQAAEMIAVQMRDVDRVSMS